GIKVSGTNDGDKAPPAASRTAPRCISSPTFVLTVADGSRSRGWLCDSLRRLSRATRNEARHAASCPAPNACPRLASRHGVRRARRRGDGGRKRNGGSVQAHDRLPADDRLYLSRDQLFGAPAVDPDLCRRP